MKIIRKLLCKIGIHKYYGEEWVECLIGYYKRPKEYPNIQDGGWVTCLSCGHRLKNIWGDNYELRENHVYNSQKSTIEKLSECINCKSKNISVSGDLKVIYCMDCRLSSKSFCYDDILATKQHGK